MPSYFDFRGRRYFIGLAFNIQSYPFLKAFVKSHEIDLKLITEDVFNQIREHVVGIIKDNELKEKVKEKMISYALYKENLIIETNKFLYSHIDNSKITFECFKDLINEPSQNFMILYKKILTIIKKLNKALIITSPVSLS